MFHILIVFLVITSSIASDRWLTKKCKWGKRQSPINIEVGNAHQYSGNMRLKMGCRLNAADLWNIGTSWQLKFLSRCDTILTAPFLKGRNKLDHIHIHWPSEHTINNKRYPLEIHLVFFDNSKRSLEQAVLEENHVTVMGVFVEQSNSKCKESALKVIADEIPRIKFYNQKVQINTRINIADLIPPGPFAFYSGSLSTHDCDEGVQWIVKMNPIKLCKSQINQLKNLRGVKGGVLVENNRPIQPLNNRTITFYD